MFLVLSEPSLEVTLCKFLLGSVWVPPAVASHDLLVRSSEFFPLLSFSNHRASGRYQSEERWQVSEKFLPLGAMKRKTLQNEHQKCLTETTQWVLQAGTIIVTHDTGCPKNISIKGKGQNLEHRSVTLNVVNRAIRPGRGKEGQYPWADHKTPYPKTLPSRGFGQRK